jgi:hypothetical protein
MTESLEVKTTLLKELKHARILRVEGQPTLIIEATAGYIPFDAFQQIFDETGKQVIAHKIEKLVFDKRQMTTFHQPSMEWYYTQWKEEMLAQGLRKHRKILPDDQLFRHSVEVGREKIYAQHPDAKFTQLDLQYAESIEEALAK